MEDDLDWLFIENKRDEDDERTLEELIAEGKDIEMNCHFCNENYNFNVEELKEILKKAKK